MMLLTSSMLAAFSLSLSTGCATTGDGRADEGLRRAAHRESRLIAMRRQALAGALNQQQWDVLMEKLRQTHERLDAVGKAGNVLFEVLNVERAAPAEPTPSDPANLKRVQQRLAQVRRALLGRRRGLTPETLRLHTLESQLLREQRALTAHEPR
jgi:hypothetical protein